MIADLVRKPTKYDGSCADSMIMHPWRLRVHAFWDGSRVDVERVDEFECSAKRSQGLRGAGLVSLARRPRLGRDGADRSSRSRVCQPGSRRPRT
jgi:hypothetical protein